MSCRSKLAVVLLLIAQFTAASAFAAPVGEDLYRAKCLGCHAIGCNRLGPKLEGLFGRQAGSVADFQSYTPELRKSGLVWSEKTLDAFLRDPGKMVPGTAMAAAGRIESPKERKDLIAYLRGQHKDLDLCF